MLTLADIRSARERIRDGVVETLCAPARSFEDVAPGTLWFKFENHQRTGSFKDRGSLNKLLQLDSEQRRRGVIAASAGNHAQALAYHGGRLGVPVTVVMPDPAPLIKVSNTRAYGARVVQSGAILDESAVEARRLAESQGLVMVPAFDDEAVMAGQGTMALELLESIPDVDTVVVPVGGGGMISGVAVAIKEQRPEVRVIGVEAEAAPSARASRSAGHIVKISATDTLADGIAVKRVGDLTFPVIQKYVDDLVVVSEEEIASAIFLLLERRKTVVEGAGAVGLAALVSSRIPVRGRDERIAVVLSGGNIDVNRVSRIIDRGLVLDGRAAHLMVKVPDRPGFLARLTETVARLGANVRETYHRRAFADISVGEVEIVLNLETRGREHVDEIIRMLEAMGLSVEEDG